jgi:hypothetical protein
MIKGLDVAKVGLSGKVASWEVINPDGSVADACYEPGNNLILDVGLDMIGNNATIPSCFAYLAMGTGTSASTVGMTALETETVYGVGGARPAASGYTAYDSITIPAASADPFVVIYQIGIQTAVGKLTGTFTELGFGPTSVKGANLFSRFRIVDSLGAPTSITVAVDQQLRLKYQLYIRFLPIVPTAYECVVTGVNDEFGYTAGWQSISLTSVGQILTLFGTSACGLFDATTNQILKCFSMISTATINYSTLTATLPALENYSNLVPTASLDAYVDGTYSNFVNVVYTTLQVVGNIYGMQLNTYRWYESLNSTYWLVKFTTPIVKADTHNLAFKLKFSWGRDT